MRRNLFAAALLASVCAVTPLDWAGAQPVSAAAAIAYPQTRRMDLVEKQFGVSVADAYRWLENDVRSDPEVKTWVDQQNAVTNAFLNTLAGREQLKHRLTQLFDYERFAAHRADRLGGETPINPDLRMLQRVMRRELVLENDCGDGRLAQCH